MNKIFRLKRNRNRIGAVAVETAIVLPLFVMLIFGLIEFGRAMMCMQVLTNAAREGARACAVSPLTEAEVEQICIDYADDCGMPGLRVEVTPDPTTVIRGEPVEVKVLIDFDDVALFPPFYAKEAVLQSSSTMRKEREYD